MIVFDCCYLVFVEVLEWLLFVFGDFGVNLLCDVVIGLYCYWSDFWEGVVLVVFGVC